MNIADIYAIGCLLVWSISFGIGTVMLCMKRTPKEKLQFPLGWVIGTVIIGLLITMNLAADNPNYLAWVLIVLVFLLSGIAAWRHRYRMLKIAVCFMLTGTLLLFFLWPGSDASRYKARAKGFVNQLQTLSIQDKNIYPGGLFSPEHPFFTAHPDLKEMWTYLSGRSPAWHTGFTGLYVVTPFSPIPFREGTIADNLETLQEHIYQAKP